MRYRIAQILLFFLPVYAIAQGGLMFSSNDSIISKRTSYNVFEYHSPVFADHFHIYFDISLWDNQNLGYIFNLITKTNSYSFNYLYSKDGAHLNFNIDSKSNKLSAPLDSTKLNKNNWMQVKFDFYLKSDSVVVSIDKQKYYLNHLELTNEIRPILVFGKNQSYTEVPRMAIKNLQVGDDEKAYIFPLKEWSGDTVYSDAGEKTGLVKNPVWLENESFYWTQIYDQTFATVRGLNYDLTNNELYIFGQDSILFFNIENNNITAFAYKAPLSMPMVLGKNIFNSRQNKIYAYELYNDDKSVPSIASLDLNTMTWQILGKTKFEYQRHHHNVFYNGNQDSIFIFGGYGGFAYHKDFYTYDKTKDKWQPIKFTGDSITPRFFSAYGYSKMPNEIYLFGGYGNESGSQVVGGKQYYDLYQINLLNHTIKKCWEIHPNEVFVPANNLILSPDGQYFYAICYPHETFKTSLRLYKFSIKDGSYEIVSAPIPVTSERIETDINLFLDSKSNKLLCTVQEFYDTQNSNVKIYSLNFPPVNKLNSVNPNFSKNVSGFKYIYIAITIIFLILIGIFLFILHKKKEAKNNQKNDVFDIKQDNIDNEKNLQTDFVQIEEDNKELKYINANDNNIKQSLNAVYLFGEFKVYDKKGIDISHLFSPKIRQLFVLILLNSRNSVGISSKKISSVLWSDKDVNKTKNIKNVTLNHLRNILSSINGIELLFSSENYLFEIKDQFFCDYYFIRNGIRQNDSFDKERFIAEYFPLIKRGQLLKEMDDEWLDIYKSEYANQIVNILSNSLPELYSNRNYSTALEFANTILEFDPFNELAFNYQINCSRKLKGLDYSKKIYENFTNNYKKLLGEPYKFKLEDILL